MICLPGSVAELQSSGCGPAPTSDLGGFTVARNRGGLARPPNEFISERILPTLNCCVPPFWPMPRKPSN